MVDIILLIKEWCWINYLTNQPINLPMPLSLASESELSARSITPSRMSVSSTPPRWRISEKSTWRSTGILKHRPKTCTSSITSRSAMLSKSLTWTDIAPVSAPSHSTPRPSSRTWRNKRQRPWKRWGSMILPKLRKWHREVLCLTRCKSSQVGNGRLLATSTPKLTLMLSSHKQCSTTASTKLNCKDWRFTQIRANIRKCKKCWTTSQPCRRRTNCFSHYSEIWSHRSDTWVTLPSSNFCKNISQPEMKSEHLWLQRVKQRLPKSLMTSKNHTLTFSEFKTWKYKLHLAWSYKPSKSA